jgi:hypothetical protein
MFLFFKNLFKRRTKQNTFMAKPAPETLETRDLPSAGPAFFVHAPALGPLAHVSANFGDKMVIDYNGHLRNSMSAGSMTILSAALTGASGATGTVDFSSTTNSASNSFHLTVSGLTASTTYSIQIDGATIGQVTTDANGDGSVSLTDLTASVASGSVVTVVDAGTTALQGTLGTGDGCHFGASQSGSNLTAGLTGASGTSGSAAYSSGASSARNSLVISVLGLTANTTYSIEIGTTVIGQITTDTDGDGMAWLSNISATVVAGSTISILDANSNTVLTGTFAAATFVD